MAKENYEPTALANDSGRGTPVLSGKDAAEFIERADMVYRDYVDGNKKDLTYDEKRLKLNLLKLMKMSKERDLRKLDQEIEELEVEINC